MIFLLEFSFSRYLCNLSRPLMGCFFLKHAIKLRGKYSWFLCHWSCPRKLLPVLLCFHCSPVGFCVCKILGGRKVWIAPTLLSLPLPACSQQMAGTAAAGQPESWAYSGKEGKPRGRNYPENAARIFWMGVFKVKSVRNVEGVIVNANLLISSSFSCLPLFFNFFYHALSFLGLLPEVRSSLPLEICAFAFRQLCARREFFVISSSKLYLAPVPHLPSHWNQTCFDVLILGRETLKSPPIRVLLPWQRRHSCSCNLPAFHAILIFITDTYWDPLFSCPV